MVTNLETGSSAEVTINDRGPFAKGRIIDLSYGAGKALGMIGPGTIPVRVEVLDGSQQHSIDSHFSGLHLAVGIFLANRKCATAARQAQKFLCGRFHRPAASKGCHVLSGSVGNLLQSQRRRRTSAPTLKIRIPGDHYGEIGECSCSVGVSSCISLDSRIKACLDSRPCRVASELLQLQASAAISQPPESFTELKQKIALFRGLPFKREISLAKESRMRLKRLSEGILSDEYGAQSLVHISRTYKRLGLLPESIDFAAALADYVRLERIFYYESRKDLIVISPVATQLVQAMREEPGRNLEQLPVVLALARALQEQHFQWQEKLNRISLEDRKLAFRALAVGDSVLVGIAYLQASQQPTTPSDSVRTLARWATVLEKMGSHLPQLLQQKLVFPYREGSQFVQWAHAAKGWTGVNALFADPPFSTSQILHPEKYYVKRENPLASALQAWRGK